MSQSAQLQLEALVLRLRKGFYTVNNSFREENYDDPESKNRRLSEFTLIEPERPYGNQKPERVLNNIIKQAEQIIKTVTDELLLKNRRELSLLGGDVDYLQKITHIPFNIITYDQAIDILNKKYLNHYKFGDDMGIREERFILQSFNNVPTFITYHPTKLKFFNMKRTKDGQKTFSFDLLLPPLGETVGGAVREEDGDKIKKYLLNSKIGKFIADKNQDPIMPFEEYFNLFKEEGDLVRGGFGVGFERFIGFVINSNDILNTIADTGINIKQ